MPPGVSVSSQYKPFLNCHVTKIVTVTSQVGVSNQMYDNDINLQVYLVDCTKW